MQRIGEKVRKGSCLVADGAWGTMLQSQGLSAGECAELWCVTHRDGVMSVARSYVEAGADLIETNSFGATCIKLAHYGLAHRAAELNKAAAAISREAAGSDRHVMASIGPTGAMLITGDISESQMYDAFAEQAAALEQGGADAVCIETMSALDEALCAIRAARENTKLEILCTFTFSKSGEGAFHTMMGVSPQEMTRAIVAAGADVIGTNCGNGIDNMIEIVKQIRAVDASTPVLVKANAGLPEVRDGAVFYPQTPEHMAAAVGDLIAAGANIVGGCCGTTPAHIRAIAGAVRGER